MKLNSFGKKICNYKFAQNFTCTEKKGFQTLLQQRISKTEIYEFES